MAQRPDGGFDFGSLGEFKNGSETELTIPTTEIPSWNTSNSGGRYNVRL
jgi:hypothetical protein